LQHIRAALAYCGLPKTAGVEELHNWIVAYRRGREAEMTPAEAGQAANADRPGLRNGDAPSVVADRNQQTG